MAEQELVLVADIGGTNTRVAFGDMAGKLHYVQALKNSEISDLRDLLARTIAAGEGRAALAVLALAGPVDGDEVRLTNYSWNISRSDLQESLGLRRLILVNDFLATAHAIPIFSERDVVPIQSGEARIRGNILLCGPGTGFGAAALIDFGGINTGLSSEAGHMLLGATSQEEVELFARISPRNGRTAVEDVLSGGGLVAVHRALSGKTLTPDEIMSAALAGEADAHKTGVVFMNIFGRVTGDLALAYNALSGVYITGGIGRALASFYNESPFVDSFCNHPPYSGRLRQIPIFVVAHEHPGLAGALQIGISAARSVDSQSRMNS